MEPTAEEHGAGYRRMAEGEDASLGVGLSIISPLRRARCDAIDLEGGLPPALGIMLAVLPNKSKRSSSCCLHGYEVLVALMLAFYQL